MAATRLCNRSYSKKGRKWIISQQDHLKWLVKTGEGYVHDKLLVACVKGDLIRVRTYLAAGHSPDEFYHENPSHQDSENDSKEDILSRIKRHMGNPFRPYLGDRPLHTAMRTRNMQLLMLLMEFRADPYTRTSAIEPLGRGLSPIEVGVRSAFPAGIRYLHETHAIPLLIDDYPAEALLCDAVPHYSPWDSGKDQKQRINRLPDEISLFDYLVETLGVSPSKVKQNGTPLLSLACQVSSAAFVTYLLETYGLDPNEEYECGSPAFDLSLSDEALASLAENGDHDPQKTAPDWLNEFNEYSRLSDLYDTTALSSCAFHGNIEQAQALCAHGADPLRKDRNGNNAFSALNAGRKAEPVSDDAYRELRKIFQGAIRSEAPLLLGKAPLTPGLSGPRL